MNRSDHWLARSTGGVPAPVEVGEGRTRVRLELIPQGPDWVLLISGGAAHVGAVAVASASDPVDRDAPALAVGPHREGPLAAECAAIVARAAGTTCAAAAGIHQDDATAEEIARIVANCRRGAERLAAALASPGPEESA